MLRFFTLCLCLCHYCGSVAQTKNAASFFNPEICDNGFDDDDDGYVDCYDTDCDCFTEVPCVGEPPKSITARLAWRTTSKILTWSNIPMVANLNPQAGDLSEIIIAGGVSQSVDFIHIYQGDGSNADQPDRVSVMEGLPYYLTPAIGDLDGDGRPEVVVVNKIGRIQVLRNYVPGATPAMELWLTSDQPTEGPPTSSFQAAQKRPHLADFDGDGRAEIYAGNSIFQLDLSDPLNPQLKKMLNGNGPEGAFRSANLSSDTYTASTAADLLTVADCNGDPDCDGLELVAGGTIYSVDLDVTDGDGLEIKAVRQLNTPSWGDGYTAVGDVDLDGIPDAVVSSRHRYSGLTEWGVYIHDKNGLKRFLPHPDRFVTNGGGMVCIANVYDDTQKGFAKDYPEIIAVGEHRLTCFNLNAATINQDQPWWWSIEVDEPSGATACSAFDFNGDGRPEIVYRDESELRILYGGAAPFPQGVDAQRNWWKITTGSGTLDEYPTIADVNGDGQAEIIIVGQDTPFGPPFPSLSASDLRIYESAAAPWSPCRPVWHQYNYSSVGISDDLRVPAQQQKHWLEFPAAGSGNYPFNGHLGQSPSLNSQFVPVYPLPDAVITLDSFSLGQQVADLYVRVCNQGSTTLRANMPLRFYLSDPTQSAAIAHGTFYFLPNNIAPGSCLQWKIQVPLPPSNQIWCVINDSSVLPAPFNLATDFPVTGIRECNYVNNLSQFDLKPLPSGPCQSATFLKLIGEPGKVENISALRAAPDGNLYLAGRKGDRTALSKMTPDGAFLWTRSFITDPNEPVLIAEIIIDSEGMIVGSGRKGLPETAKGFAFRYDPVADQMLWAHQIDSDQPTEGGILEKMTGGNYLLYQCPNLPDTTEQAEILELDRSTGQIVPAFARRYHFAPFKQALKGLVEYNGALYGTGYVQTSDTHRKMWLTKLDANTGDPIWTNASHHGWARPSNLTGTDLIVQDSSILTVYFGNDTSSSITNLPTKIFLQKTTLDGEVVWIHQYTTTGYPKEIAAVPDGYVILVFGGNYDRRLLKTDKNGNLLISNRIDNPPANFFTNGEQQNQIELIGDRLFIADYATSNLGDQYTTLLKINQNLELAVECSRYGPIQVPDSSFLSIRNAFPQFVNVSPATQQAFSIVFSPDTVTVRETCPNCPDSVCTDKPDITCRVDSIFCSGQVPFINIKICNLGQVAPTQFTYLNFYDKNPFTEAATLIAQVGIVDKPDSSSCVTFPIPLDVSLFQYSKIYTLTGIINIVPTPISLDSFPFAGGFAECDYANNLDSFEVKLPDLKKLDLGPDRSICQGEITNLDAGSGYVQYNWKTGAGTQTIGVAANGNYAIEVIDACGRKQYDTVRVTVFPNPKRSVKVVLLPGDSIIIGGNTYFSPAIVMDTVPALTGVCDTVVTYTIMQMNLTNVSITCPANFTVTLPPNSNSTVVDYNGPTATTDCPDPTVTLKQLQGPPIGGSFPQGATQVCYEAANQCGIRDTCCFTITAQQPDPPCDVKTPPGCIRYELLNIRVDSIGQRRYRVRMTNTCASPLEFAYIQLPNGVLAVSPKEGATYTAPGGNTYTVRNPNASPFYSVRYKASTGSLNNGKSDIFEYKLPQQSQPAYIHVAAKLADGSTSEAHLTTFYCPVLMDNNVMEHGAWSIQAPFHSQFSIPKTSLSVRPNPTSGQLLVDLSSWQGQSVQMKVLNAQGQVVLEFRYVVENESFALELSDRLASGLYYLLVQPDGGQREAVRFVLER